MGSLRHSQVLMSDVTPRFVPGLFGSVIFLKNVVSIQSSWHLHPISPFSPSPALGWGLPHRSGLLK